MIILYCGCEGQICTGEFIECNRITIKRITQAIHVLDNLEKSLEVNYVKNLLNDILSDYLPF
jgi:hypothetical protein